MDKVRLTKAEVDAILAVTQGAVGNGVATIRLYGSRADPTKKGGDIDLAIEVLGAVGDKFLVTQTLRQGLCSRLGDQKIDIFLISVDSSLNTERENAFFALIREGSRVLWRAHE